MTNSVAVALGLTQNHLDIETLMLKLDRLDNDKYDKI